MRRPVVGVMPLWDEKKDSIWMLPGYLDGIREAGGIPFIFPLTEDMKEIGQLMVRCDGILLTGGQDVSPDMYGEEIREGTECCRKRDMMEMAVLDIAVSTDIPVLGICRGIQFLNAYLGGTLYQDLPSQHPSDVVHHQSAPYEAFSHDVRILNDTPLFDLLKSENISVNSYHHQAVKDLSDRLRPMAQSPDGLCEAVYMPDRTFVWAVQWHPEFSYRKDDNSLKIFKAFRDAMLY